VCGGLKSVAFRGCVSAHFPLQFYSIFISAAHTFNIVSPPQIRTSQWTIIYPDMKGIRIRGLRRYRWVLQNHWWMDGWMDWRRSDLRADCRGTHPIFNFHFISERRWLVRRILKLCHCQTRQIIPPIIER
jgi:hypothetical protein